MTKARIFRPDKNAMQSGMAKRSWLFEYIQEQPVFVENLMGWTGSKDMPQQVRMYFSSKEAAIVYADSQQIPFEVVEPHIRQQQRKAYADNFKFNRLK